MKPLKNFFEINGMELIDVERIEFVRRGEPGQNVESQITRREIEAPLAKGNIDRRALDRA